MSVAGTHMMVACENKTRSMSCGASRACRSGTRLPHIACSSFQLGRACTHAMNPSRRLQIECMGTCLQRCASAVGLVMQERQQHTNTERATPGGLSSAPLASRDITRHHATSPDMADASYYRCRQPVCRCTPLARAPLRTLRKLNHDRVTRESLHGAERGGRLTCSLRLALRVLTLGSGGYQGRGLVCQRAA